MAVAGLAIRFRVTDSWHELAIAELATDFGLSHSEPGLVTAAMRLGLASFSLVTAAKTGDPFPSSQISLLKKDKTTKLLQSLPLTSAEKMDEGPQYRKPCHLECR